MKSRKQRVFGCPYCDVEVGDGVTSCRFCNRDLAPILPLIGRIDILENQLADVEILLTPRGSEQPLLPAPPTQLGSETLAPGQRRWVGLPVGYVTIPVAYSTVVF